MLFCLFHKGELAIVTSVTQCYTGLWFPGAGGNVVQKEIRTAGGEGGASVIEQIRQTLIDEGELITSQQVSHSTLRELSKLFFPPGTDTMSVRKVRENFCRLRHWPILETPAVLEQLIREGVKKGVWGLFRIEDETSTEPVEFYSQDSGDLPFDLDFSKDYNLITPEGAKQRHWGSERGLDLSTVKDWVWEVVASRHAATVNKIREEVVEKYGEVPQDTMDSAISKLVQEKRSMAYKNGIVDQREKPALITGNEASFYIPEPEDVVITPKKSAERGWIAPEEKGLQLDGKEAVNVLLPLLRRLGSLYQRGATSTLDTLDLIDLELPHGGTLRISLMDASPESVRKLGEFFEVVAGVVSVGDQTDAYLDIRKPDENCPLVQEIKKQLQEGQ